MNLAHQTWKSPAYEATEFRPKRSRYCLCVFVLNEDGRLQSQLQKMAALMPEWDVIVADGGSTDGCNEPEMLKALGVRSLLIKQGPGKLGAQMRMAFAYALSQGYEGVITVDGNDKDNVVAGFPLFVEKLDIGFDHIQGSRFIKGGYHKRTPATRLAAVRLLHAPVISLAAGFHYTDTTNGFRGYSKKFLLSDKIAACGAKKNGYDLHYFLSIHSSLAGSNCCEVPVSRCYPPTKQIPTKIRGAKGNAKVLGTLFFEALAASNITRPLVLPILWSILATIVAILFWMSLISADFSLGNFYGRIIGEPVLSGIDTGKRSYFLIFLYIMTAFGGFIGYLLKSLVSKLKPHSEPSLWVDFESRNCLDSIVSSLSISTFFLVILDLADSGNWRVLLSCSIGAWVVFLAAWLLLTLLPRTANSLRLVSPYQIGVAASVHLSIGSVLRLLLNNKVSIFATDGLALASLTFASAWVIALVENRSRTFQKYYSLIAAAISLQPLVFIMASEIQYILASRGIPITRNLILLSAELITLSCLFIVWRYFVQKKVFKVSPWIFMTFAAATLSIYTNHTNSTVFNYGDLFHSSEAILPPLEFARFGKLPWLDIFPTHGLSDHIFAYLHALLSGRKDLEIIAWDWLQPSFLSFFSLLALSTLVGFVPSVLVVFLFPKAGLATINIDIGIFSLGFLMVIKAILSQTRATPVLIQTLFLCSFFYYPAVGVPLSLAGISCICFARFLKTNSFTVLYETGTAIISFALFCTGASILRTGTVNPIIQWIEFTLVQGQSMAYKAMVNNDVDSILKLYALQPILISGIGIVALFRLWEKRSEQSWKNLGLLFSLFCSIAVLISFNRHVQRWCQYVGVFNDNATWTAVMLSGLILIWWPIRPATRPLSYAIKTANSRGFLILALAGLICLFRGGQPMLKDEFAIQIKSWRVGENRVLNPIGEPTDIVATLRKFLMPNQTFYNLANKPALYVATGTSFPTFVIPSFYHTSKISQARVVTDLKKLFKEGRLPFVVYQALEGGWDNSDGVPNSVRSYLVADFIHKNFRPCKKVGTWRIWCRISETAPQEDNLQDLTENARVLDLLPSVWGRFDSEPLQKKPKLLRAVPVSQLGGEYVVFPTLPPTMQRESVGLLLNMCSIGSTEYVVFGLDTDGVRVPFFRFLTGPCAIKKQSQVVLSTKNTLSEKDLDFPFGGFEHQDFKTTPDGWIKVELKPTAYCQKRHEDKMLSKGNSNFVIQRERFTIGCVPLEVLARVDKLGWKSTPKKDDVYDHGDLSALNSYHDLWQISRVHSVSLQGTPHLIWLGMSPGWFASNLKTIGLGRSAFRTAYGVPTLMQYVKPFFPAQNSDAEPETVLESATLVDMR